MSDTIGSVILAAGQGTRLKLKVSKPLAPIMDKCLVDYPLKTVFDFRKDNNLKGILGVVTGYMKEELEEYLTKKYIKNSIPLSFAHQEQQLGTADALRAYFSNIPEAKEQTYTLVMCADTPLITSKDILKLYNSIKDNALDGVAASFTAQDPTGYGRIIGGAPGFKIVEEKDATAGQKEITEVNSGVYILKTDFILKHLESIGTDNNSGEFYLTDLFKTEYKVQTVHFENEMTFLGVNTLKQLETCENYLRINNMKQLQEEGVRFVDLRHTYVHTSEVGKGTTIYPNAYIDSHSIIGEDVVIGPGVFIENSIIEDGVKITAYSHLENSMVKNEAKIGPFAHLRPGSNVGKKSKIGNFVELKNATLEENVSVSHLSYVGDAEIGSDTNIGCGFITCNYDGANKNKTVIGSGSFIGSDTQMIAPINIGKECYVASGSTINQDMPDGAFAIARGRQTTKEGMAKRFIKKKKDK